MSDLPPPDPSELVPHPPRPVSGHGFSSDPAGSDGPPTAALRSSRWLASALQSARPDNDSTKITATVIDTTAVEHRLAATTAETSAPPTRPHRRPRHQVDNDNSSSTTTSPTTRRRRPPPSHRNNRPGSVAALDVLALIPVANEDQDGYDRDRFGYPADRDGDGCDTHDEVLRRDSLTPAQVDPSGCQVIAGDWYSSYDGVTHTDPAEVQIDHVVSVTLSGGTRVWPHGRVGGMPLTSQRPVVSVRREGLGCPPESQVFAMRCCERPLQCEQLLAMPGPHLLDLR